MFIQLVVLPRTFFRRFDDLNCKINKSPNGFGSCRYSEWKHHKRMYSHISDMNHHASDIVNRNFIQPDHSNLFMQFNIIEKIP